jgi:predicted acylesterase/phospholipase RssA
VLIDGGTMDDVPADVVKAMGADRVVAINVGDLSDREGVSHTMFAVAGSTLDDAMMRPSTRRVWRQVATSEGLAGCLISWASRWSLEREVG